MFSIDYIVIKVLFYVLKDESKDLQIGAIFCLLPSYELVVAWSRCQL
jgi:hypothetical protein